MTRRCAGWLEGGRVRAAAGTLGLVLLASGCTSVQDRIDTEQRLSAAGFTRQNAQGPDVAAELRSLPPESVIARKEGAGFRYLYADPVRCHCLYVGDENAYQAYQRLTFQDRIANQNRAAAEAYREPFGYGFGSPFFYPREVVVVRDRDHH